MNGGLAQRVRVERAAFADLAPDRPLDCFTPAVTDLLPCPFCGGKAMVAESRLHTGVIEWVRSCCSNPGCAATGPAQAVETKAGAVAAWNTRHRADTTAPLVEALPMETAPKNGTMIRLLINYRDGGGQLDDDEIAWTIGFNGFEDHGIDEWKFAGWCWTHDHFIEGSGTPIGWLPWSNPPTAEIAAHKATGQ